MSNGKRMKEIFSIEQKLEGLNHKGETMKKVAAKYRIGPVIIKNCRRRESSLRSCTFWNVK
jgi:hypothetical protein